MLSSKQALPQDSGVDVDNVGVPKGISMFSQTLVQHVFIHVSKISSLEYSYDNHQTLLQ